MWKRVKESLAWLHDNITRRRVHDDFSMVVKN